MDRGLLCLEISTVTEAGARGGWASVAPSVRILERQEGLSSPFSLPGSTVWNPNPSPSIETKNLPRSTGFSFCHRPSYFKFWSSSTGLSSDSAWVSGLCNLIPCTKGVTTHSSQWIISLISPKGGARLWADKSKQKGGNSEFPSLLQTISFGRVAVDWWARGYQGVGLSPGCIWACPEPSVKYQWPGLILSLSLGCSTV